MSALYNAYRYQTDDIKYLVKEKKDYIDIIFIFKHKGMYSTLIFANENETGNYKSIVEYHFDSLEEWGEKLFDFSMDDNDIMDKLKLENMSHKDYEFIAENREKLSFKFKPDAKIKINSVSLKLENDNNSIEKVAKYYMENNNLDIEVIFNKKGKYTLYISFYDFSSDEKNGKLKSLRYYPIVSSDAEEEKEFSEEEFLFTQPFEDSLNIIKFKLLSQKKQNIAANRIETFEFECEDKDIDISSRFYPDNSKILTKNKKENNKFIFHFGFNEKKKFIIQFEFSKNYDTINDIVYIVNFNGEIDIPFSSAETYGGNEIILIDPIFPKLKMGKEVTLKFKSDEVDEIIATNGEWLYIKKNNEGIFEVKFTPATDEIFILKKKGDSDEGTTSMIFKVEKNNSTKNNKKNKK